ncbi:NAD(P)-binding protein, partial [Pluteus cervinus]
LTFFSNLVVNGPVKVPENVSYDQASTVPLAAATAYIGLYKGLGLAPLTTTGIGAYSNTPIVIIGGSSSVGQYGLQFAKASGFSPIITTASLKHAEYLKSIGATHVINRNSSLAAEITKITDKPVLFALDAI